VTDVSKSDFYDWRRREPSEHAKCDQALLVKIKESFERRHGIYGSPRVYDDLVSEDENVSPKRVARLM